MAQRLRGVAGKRSVVGGYDPYDAEPTARLKAPAGKHKPTDLRKLSEWIRLKREVEQLNHEAPKKKQP